MTKQVAHQRAVLADLLGSIAVTHARGLHNCGVGGLSNRRKARHDINKRNESMLMNWNFPARATVHQVAHGRLWLHAANIGIRFGNAVCWNNHSLIMR